MTPGMKCLRCQHENPPQSRFCFECGAPLAPTCSSCGAELPAGVKFCNQCRQAAGGQVHAKLLLLGRLDEARRLGDRAVESSPRQLGFVARALHLLGDLATHPERFDAARGEAHYRKALELVEQRGMRPLVAHGHFGLGKLYRRTGKAQQANEHLATATTMYREMEMQFYLKQAEAEFRTPGDR